MWVEELMGFDEGSPDQVREQCRVEAGELVSLVNQKRFQLGEFHLLSLAEIREQSDVLLQQVDRPSKVSESVGNVQAFHQLPDHRGALFQVASQFNLLEMVGPSVTPEQGVGIYQYDGTQGPACAIACGAGTIYRNYFVPIGDQIGQTEDCQIDCLALLGEAFGNSNQELWAMRNGYALASQSGLEKVSEQLANANRETIDEWRGLLQVGAHFNTEVTLDAAGHCVSQLYCSATPVAYSRLSSSSWAPLAQLVLEAAYESTMRLALINREKTGSDKVFLTLLGGGAFGNASSWIVGAMLRAIDLVANCGLDIRIVSYGSKNPTIKPLLERWSTL